MEWSTEQGVQQAIGGIEYFTMEMYRGDWMDPITQLVGNRIRVNEMHEGLKGYNKTER